MEVSLRSFSPDSSGKPGEGTSTSLPSADSLSVTTEAQLCAGLAAQPNKKQLSIAFLKVASEALRATQVWKKRRLYCSSFISSKYYSTTISLNYHSTKPTRLFNYGLCASFK